MGAAPSRPEPPINLGLAELDASFILGRDLWSEAVLNGIEISEDAIRAQLDGGGSSSELFDDEEPIRIGVTGYVDPVSDSYNPILPNWKGVQRTFPWRSNPRLPNSVEDLYDTYQKTQLVAPTQFACDPGYFNLGSGKCLNNAFKGYERIVTRAGLNQCITVPSGAPVDGRLSTAPCATTENFRFNFNYEARQIRVMSSTNCLEVDTTPGVNLSRVVLKKCNTTAPFQQWSYDTRTQQIRSLQTDTCLDIVDGGRSQEVVLGVCSTDSNTQKFLDLSGNAIFRGATDSIPIPKPPIPDFGKSLGPFDSKLTEIPWDADNMSFRPEDILWGFVGENASKSIFRKVYINNLMSNNGLIDDPDEKALPDYFSPAFQVASSNPADSQKLQLVEGVVIAGGNAALSKAYDFAEDVIFGDTKKMKLAIEEIEQSKTKRKIGQRLKNFIGVTKARLVMAKVKERIARFLRNQLSKMLQRYATGSLAAKASSAVAAAAATGGSIFLPFLAPVAAAAVAFAKAINSILAVADVICMALNIFIPPLLDKILEPSGFCPAESKPLETFLPDELYFFLANFVPVFGDVMDLFSPYICFKSDGSLVLKEKVKQQPYFSDDRTLSLYYHDWSPDEEPRGTILAGRDNTGFDGYTCVGNVCYGQCPAGYNLGYDNAGNLIDAGSSTSSICYKDTKSRTSTERIPYFTPCNSVTEKDDGSNCRNDLTCASLTTFEWEYRNGGYTNIACTGGANITKTEYERYDCTRTSDGTLMAQVQDPNTTDTTKRVYPDERVGTMCYRRCDVLYGTNFRGAGNQCVLKSATAPVVQRPMKTKSNNRRYIRGNNPPPLSGVNGFPWCNFSSPKMLNRMANFYYNNSLANPRFLEDGRTEVHYITRFFGVIASSEYSCDVVCLIRTLRYDPLTGDNFEELYGSPPKPLAEMNENRFSTRRFYFTKTPRDPQGIFTVTGCTNADSTAVEAMVQSLDEGVAYVPSLPKTFQVTEKTRDTTSAGFFASVLVGSLVNAAAMAPALIPGAGVSGGVAAGAFGPVMTNLLQKQLIELDTKVGGLPVADPNCKGYCIRGDKDKGFFVATDTDQYVINHGPIYEFATGFMPTIGYCQKTVISNEVCAHKDNLRDIINRYEADSKRKVRQVNYVEARGKNACFYNWWETTFDPATGEQGTQLQDSSYVFFYDQPDLSTCVFVPRQTNSGSGAQMYENAISSSEPIRTLPVPNAENSIAIYPTRRITIDLSGREMFVPMYPNGPFYVPQPLPKATTLGGAKCPRRRCEDIDQAAALINDFNDANKDRKILKILRGWTPQEGRCDYEVEMLRVAATESVLRRETVTIAVAEKTGQPCFFTRSSDGSATINSGTFIQPNIPTEMNWSKPEVFIVGNYEFARSQAEAVCARVGAAVATYAQVEAAQRAEADWCHTGWVSDRTSAVYPITTRLEQGCGGGSAGVKSWTPPNQLAAVNCFGPKPTESGVLPIRPFNARRWRLEDEVKTSLKNGVGAVPAKLQTAQKTLSDAAAPVLAIDLDKSLVSPMIQTVQSAQNVMDASFGVKELALPCFDSIKKCSEPYLLNYIVAKYNEENTTNGAFNIDKNTVRKVLKAGASSSTSCDLLIENLYEYYGTVLDPPEESTVSLKAIRVNFSTDDSCEELFDSITSVEKSGAILSAATQLQTPLVPARCVFDCLNPTVYSVMKQELESQGDTKVTSILQSYNDGATKCEYLITKDITTINQITGARAVERGKRTYVSMTISPEYTAGPGGSVICNPSSPFGSVEEIDPELLESEIDPETGEEFYFIDGEQVTLPALYLYDPAKPNPKVRVETRSLV